MKKFTENINENKIINSYIELADKIFIGLKDIFKKEGYSVDDDLYDFIDELSEKLSRKVIDSDSFGKGN